MQMTILGIHLHRTIIDLLEAHRIEQLSEAKTGSTAGQIGLDKTGQTLSKTLSMGASMGAPSITQPSAPPKNPYCE